MFLPNDLSSRLKTLRRPRRVTLTGRDRSSMAWITLLLLFVVVNSAVVVLSAYRFAYWSDVDKRLSMVEKTPAYDESKLEMVLTEFEDKRRRSGEILASVAPTEDLLTGTTTATSSDPGSESGE